MRPHTLKFSLPLLTPATQAKLTLTHLMKQKRNLKNFQNTSQQKAKLDIKITSLGKR